MLPRHKVRFRVRVRVGVGVRMVGGENGWVFPPFLPTIASFTWNIFPSGENVVGERSYPDPVLLIVQMSAS